MGVDRLLHELGDGAVADAAVYCSLVAAGRGCYDVSVWFFPEIADEWGGREKSAYVDR